MVSLKRGAGTAALEGPGTSFASSISLDIADIREQPKVPKRRRAQAQPENRCRDGIKQPLAMIRRHVVVLVHMRPGSNPWRNRNGGYVEWYNGRCC